MSTQTPENTEQKIEVIPVTGAIPDLINEIGQRAQSQIGILIEAMRRENNVPAGWQWNGSAFVPPAKQ